MARSTLIRRALPGLFTDPLPPNPDQAAISARAAAVDLYQSMGIPVIVPSLDQPVPRESPLHEMLLKNPLLFAQAWYVAFRMGSIPIKVFDYPSKEENSDHPAYQLFRRPNPDLTRPLMQSGTIMSMFVFSYAGWYKERLRPNGPKDPSNPPVAVWPIPGIYFTPLRSSKRLIAGFELLVPGQPPVELDPRDVVFHRLMPGILDWAAGLSPYQALASMNDMSQEAFRRLGRLYRSAMAQRIWIDLHGADLEDEARERLRNEMSVAMGTDGRAPIMEGGATLEGLGMTANDQLLTGGIDVAEKIIRETLGLPERTADDKEFYTRVVQPIADGMEQEWERSLMTEWPKQPAYPQFMYRSILQGTPEEQARYWQVEILSGQAMPNEARRAQDREAAEGGDQLFVPLNVVPMQLAGPLQQVKADSRGGLGGTEGRGVSPRVPSGRKGEQAATNGQRAPMRATGDPLPLMMRAGGQRNWEVVRDRVIGAQSTALERRLRGVVGKEGDRLRELIAPLDRSPSRGPHSKLNAARVASEMDTTDLELASVIARVMQQTGQEAYRLALQLVEGIDAKGAPPQRLDSMVTQRSAQIIDSFRANRVEVLDQVQAGDGFVDRADVFRAIDTEWDKLGAHLSNVLAPTETAWAYERGAAIGWEDQGFSEFAVALRSSNGGCRTGICPAAAERTYTAAEVPTPMHPNCTDFVVPVEIAG